MKQDLIQTYDMLPSGARCCVPYPAERTPCVCLPGFLELGPKYGCAVAAAHYNHGLRGAQGDADEAFVRDWCAGHSVPFYAGRGDVASAAKEHGWSIEEAGRNLRYAFLSETAEQIGALRVATAHNRGDNAETVLLNLIRGTGLTGLSGIAPVRGIFVRPLLDTPRQEIEDYLAGRGIPHVEDRTNTDPAHTRNRIRHEVLPLLRQLNPRWRKHWCRLQAFCARRMRICIQRRNGCAARWNGAAKVQRWSARRCWSACGAAGPRGAVDAGSAANFKKGHWRPAYPGCVGLGAPERADGADLTAPGRCGEERLRFLCAHSGGSRPWQCAALSPVGEAVLGPWRIECRCSAVRRRRSPCA